MAEELEKLQLTLLAAAKVGDYGDLADLLADCELPLKPIINTPDTGATNGFRALHYAASIAEKGYVRIAKALVGRKEIDVNAVDNGECSPPLAPPGRRLLPLSPHPSQTTSRPCISPACTWPTRARTRWCPRC